MAITLLLKARGKMTAQRLANILGISTRTVYRDIVSLSLAHVPVSMEYGPGGGYYLPEDYHLESAIFTREEAISLILSADMSGNYNLFAGDTDLHRALVKLEAVLPEEYRQDVDVARQHILFDTSAWCNQETAPTYLETIRDAVLKAHQLDILYPCPPNCDNCPEHTAQWRRIEPQGLVFKGINLRHVRGGTWYLVAYCQACQKFDTFLVRDIEELHVLEDANPPRPRFHLHSYWREARKRLEQKPSFITLTLHVTATARQKIQGAFTTLHEEQDGSVVVQLDKESLDTAISYALGLGADVTVLEPSEVRDAVAATAHAIAEMYSV